MAAWAHQKHSELFVFPPPYLHPVYPLPVSSSRTLYIFNGKHFRDVEQCCVCVINFVPLIVNFDLMLRAPHFTVKLARVYCTMMTLKHIIKSTAKQDAGTFSYILLLVRALFNCEAKHSAADPTRKHGCGHLQTSRNLRHQHSQV